MTRNAFAIYSSLVFSICSLLECVFRGFETHYEHQGDVFNSCVQSSEYNCIKKSQINDELPGLFCSDEFNYY